MFALWMVGRYVGLVFIRQEVFTIGVIDIIAPLVIGIVEAFVWKPKEKK